MISGAIGSSHSRDAMSINRDPDNFFVEGVVSKKSEIL